MSLKQFFAEIFGSRSPQMQQYEERREGEQTESSEEQVIPSEHKQAKPVVHPAARTPTMPRTKSLVLKLDQSPEPATPILQTVAPKPSRIANFRKFDQKATDAPSPLARERADIRRMTTAFFEKQRCGHGIYPYTGTELERSILTLLQVSPKVKGSDVTQKHSHVILCLKYESEVGEDEKPAYSGGRKRKTQQVAWRGYALNKEHLQNEINLAFIQEELVDKLGFEVSVVKREDIFKVNIEGGVVQKPLEKTSFVEFLKAQEAADQIEQTEKEA